MFKKSLFIAVIGFVAGYLTNHLLESVSEVQSDNSFAQACNVLPEPLVAGAAEGLSDQSTVLVREEEVPVKGLGEEKIDKQHKAGLETPQPKVASIPPVPTGSTVAKKEDVITDVEIDALVPAPFNSQLKGMQGYLRDRYKEFAATEQRDDWDIKMRAQIEDAIYSNPYGKDLIIESLQCKAGMCELLLYEIKSGAWSFILAEMGLQSWWDIGESSSSGFSVQHEGANMVAYYVLMSRRKN
jgi:hypothetical protein